MPPPCCGARRVVWTFARERSVDHHRGITGSDVPFFLQGGDAVVSGFGERCVPTQCERFPALVLVFPATACPTGEIFDAFDEQQPQDFAPERIDEVLQGSDLEGDDLFNDLLHAAESVEPELVECRTALKPLAERTVHLTGSGSTLLFLPTTRCMPKLWPPPSKNALV